MNLEHVCVGSGSSLLLASVLQAASFYYGEREDFFLSINAAHVRLVPVDRTRAVNRTTAAARFVLQRDDAGRPAADPCRGG